MTDINTTSEQTQAAPVVQEVAPVAVPPVAPAKGKKATGDHARPKAAAGKAAAKARTVKAMADELRRKAAKPKAAVVVVAKSAPGKPGREAGTFGEFAGKRLYNSGTTNPRKPGSFGAIAWEIINKQPGIEYRAYLAAGGGANHLRWDLARGWVQVK